MFLCDVMLLYLSWCWCWCWCMLELWRNCLAAGAGAGGEISGNGTVAARQLSSARPLPRWLKVRAPPPQVHCQDQPEPSSRHQSANQRRETLVPVLGWAVMVMVGPTPIHLHYTMPSCGDLHMGTIATAQHITIQYLICQV